MVNMYSQAEPGTVDGFPKGFIVIINNIKTCDTATAARAAVLPQGITSVGI